MQADFFASTRAQPGSVRDATNNQELHNENIKITQIIKEWFDSWQPWQQKILITGIVNRFDHDDIKKLLMAMEPVFHKDFMASVRKAYPISRVRASLSATERSDSKRIDIMTRIKLAAKKRKEMKDGNVETDIAKVRDQEEHLETHTIYQSADMTSSSPCIEEDIRIPSDMVILQGITSSQLSPIEEGEPDVDEMPLTGEGDEEHGISEHGNLLPSDRDDENSASQLPTQVSHLISETRSGGTSQVSTLVSSLSPIEETSTEDPSPGGVQNLEDNTKVLEQRLQAPSGEQAEKKKKKKKKKVIPEDVVKRIASSSSSCEKTLTPVSTDNSSTETVLEFHSDLRFNVQPKDFFETRDCAVLGEPATTRSKMDPGFMEQYDTKRNKFPLPTTKQLYKNQKLWPTETVKPDISRLKEQFRKQLDQIWNWMDDWASYQRKRLLLLLFSNCGEKTVQYVAECIKNKFQQMKLDITTIDDLTDAELKMIFSLLNPHDLQQASWVCKRWYYLITCDEGLWKRKCHEMGLKPLFQ